MVWERQKFVLWFEEIRSVTQLKGVFGTCYSRPCVNERHSVRVQEMFVFFPIEHNRNCVVYVTSAVVCYRIYCYARWEKIRKRFITVFIRVRHSTLFWASLIQSRLFHSVCWRYILILPSFLRLDLKSGLLPVGSRSKFVCICVIHCT